MREEFDYVKAFNKLHDEDNTLESAVQSLGLAPPCHPNMSRAERLSRACSYLKALTIRDWLVETQDGWSKDSWVRPPSSQAEVELLLCPSGLFTASDYGNVAGFHAMWAFKVLSNLVTKGWVARSKDRIKTPGRCGAFVYQVTKVGRTLCAKLAADGITKATVWREPYVEHKEDMENE